MRLEEIQEAAFSRPSSNSTLPLAHCRITAHVDAHTGLALWTVSSYSLPLKYTFTYFREPLHMCKDLMPQHNTLALVQRAKPIELNSAGRVRPNDTGSVQPYSSQHFPEFHQLAQYCSFFLPFIVKAFSHTSQRTAESAMDGQFSINLHKLYNVYNILYNI